MSYYIITCPYHVIVPNITYGENNIYYMIYILLYVYKHIQRENEKDYSIILKSEEYIYKTLYIYTRNTNNICG